MAKLPETLGSLKLVSQLGVGRHCQIWEAVDTASRQRVAIKVVVPEAAQDVSQRSLLEHELKVAKSLEHPTIIRIDRLSVEGGLPHLVMELFPHPNLKKQIASGVDALAPQGEPEHEPERAFRIRGCLAADEIVMHALRGDPEQAGQARFFPVRPEQGGDGDSQRVPQGSPCTRPQRGAAPHPAAGAAALAGGAGEFLGHGEQRADRFERPIHASGGR